MTGPDQGSWPSLPVAEWEATRDTLHMWSQVVGKVRMALAPPVNHWWHTTLYLSPRGLTTSLIPYGQGGLEMEFDFRRHQLTLETSEGERRAVALEPKPVAQFHAETMAALGELGIAVEILPRPVEVVTAIPFPEDYEHAAYDPDAAQRFWRLLLQADRVLSGFRGRFIGKVSPVHFFWGAFDLAVTRFSGRPAPAHPGGAPNCAPWVMEEAYSHEVSSAGYLAGRRRRGRCSTPTPIPSPTASPTSPSGRTPPSTAKSCVSSCSPTRRCARPTTPTGRCSSFWSRPTKPPPSWPAGTALPWRTD